VRFRELSRVFGSAKTSDREMRPISAVFFRETLARELFFQSLLQI
jgi:hypothetical protein